MLLFRISEASASMRTVFCEDVWASCVGFVIAGSIRNLGLQETNADFIPDLTNLEGII